MSSKVDMKAYFTEMKPVYYHSMEERQRDPGGGGNDDYGSNVAPTRGFEKHVSEYCQQRNVAMSSLGVELLLQLADLRSSYNFNNVIEYTKKRMEEESSSARVTYLCVRTQEDLVNALRFNPTKSKLFIAVFPVETSRAMDVLGILRANRASCKYLVGLYLAKGLLPVLTGTLPPGVAPNLKRVYLPDGVDSWIPENCFSGTNIVQVKTGSDAVIGAHAFSKCAKLDTVLCSFRAVGRGAFEDCSNLTKVIFSHLELCRGLVTWLRIPVECFAGCTSLRKISIPTNTKIEASSFANNKSLRGVDFYLCNGTDEVDIHPTAFEGCDRLTPTEQLHEGMDYHVSKSHSFYSPEQKLAEWRDTVFWHFTMAKITINVNNCFLEWIDDPAVKSHVSKRAQGLGLGFGDGDDDTLWIINVQSYVVAVQTPTPPGGISIPPKLLSIEKSTGIDQATDCDY